jgi:hypothetical protein
MVLLISIADSSSFAYLPCLQVDDLARRLSTAGVFYNLTLLLALAKDNNIPCPFSFRRFTSMALWHEGDDNTFS